MMQSNKRNKVDGSNIDNYLTDKKYTSLKQLYSSRIKKLDLLVGGFNLYDDTTNYCRWSLNFEMLICEEINCCHHLAENTIGSLILEISRNLAQYRPVGKINVLAPPVEAYAYSVWSNRRNNYAWKSKKNHFTMQEMLIMWIMGASPGRVSNPLTTFHIPHNAHEYNSCNNSQKKIQEIIILLNRWHAIPSMKAINRTMIGVRKCSEHQKSFAGFGRADVSKHQIMLCATNYAKFT